MKLFLFPSIAIITIATAAADDAALNETTKVADNDTDAGQPLVTTDAQFTTIATTTEHEQVALAKLLVDASKNQYMVCMQEASKISSYLQLICAV